MEQREGKKRISLDVSQELKKDFGVKCLLNETTMTDVITDYIKKYTYND